MSDGDEDQNELTSLMASCHERRVLWVDGPQEGSFVARVEPDQKIEIEAPS